MIRPLPGLVGLLIVAVYLWSYHADPAMPGGAGASAPGWWGWWDQSQYLLSARSLAHADLAPEHHWYPLGYSVLGAVHAAVRAAPKRRTRGVSLLLPCWMHACPSRP